MNTRRKFGILAAILLAAVGTASTLKVWSTGEYLTSTDINANFAHIHSLMVGGHGTRLMNADVNASADIAHSKLATPALLPKAWAAISSCTGATDGGSGGACTIIDSSVITTITAGTTGVYTVNYPTRSGTYIGVFVTAYKTTEVSCHVYSVGTASSVIHCITPSTGVAVDSAFSVMLMDTEN